MGQFDEEWAHLNNRTPVDLYIAGVAILVHTCLIYPVYNARREIEKNELEQTGVPGFEENIQCLHLKISKSLENFVFNWIVLGEITLTIFTLTVQNRYAYTILS